MNFSNSSTDSKQKEILEPDLLERAARLHKWLGRRQIEEMAKLMEADPVDVYACYLRRLTEGQKLPPLLLDIDFSFRSGELP